jgi:arsenite methyltransferase
VRWLLGGELHPGGEATTRRALGLIDPQPGERLVDVACGAGASALVAADEYGLEVNGIDSSEDLLAEARAGAESRGLADRATFVAADAEALPIADESFDLALCECSLCLFEDKPRAVAEVHRVLRPGGRVALADVAAHRERLPAELRGALATIACVGEALSAEELARLLEATGFVVRAMELRRDEAAAMASRVEDRLRGARVLGVVDDEALPGGVDEAIELVRLARREIDRGNLGYAILGAWKR